MPLSGIGIGEMLVIAMLVLIVFGPHRLPEITRQMGKALREFKRGMNEIQRELDVADREQRWGRSAAVAAGAASASASSRSGASPGAGDPASDASDAGEASGRAGGGKADAGSATAGGEAPVAPPPTSEPTIAPPVFGSDLPDEIESQLAPPPEMTAVTPSAPAAAESPESESDPSDGAVRRRAEGTSADAAPGDDASTEE